MPPFHLAAGAGALGFHLDDLALRRFETYRLLIVDASSRFNLTAIRDPDEIDRRHFLDALGLGEALVRLCLLPEGCKVIDIGSGAGLPGLPLKIARPNLRLSLLEANAKRSAFLREAIRELELEQVAVIEGRAEDVAHDPAHRAAYDLALARAIAPLPVLLEYALPFLRAGGHLAATKGRGAERELDQAKRALAVLGGEAREAIATAPPGGIASLVVVIEKTSPTPDRYPRRTGVPGKRPLI